MLKPGSKSFEFEKSTQDGHSSTFRSHIIADKEDLKTVLPDGSTTIYEMLQKTIIKYGPNICFGNRRVVDIIEEVKEVEKKDAEGNTYKENKTWKYFHLSEYEWVTYQELGQHLTYLGSALVHLGIKKGDKIALYAPTSRYWSSLANACYTQSITSVTVYDTLGPEGLQHGLNECEVPAVFVAPEQVKTLIKVLPNIPTLNTIIYTGDISESDKEALLAINSDLKIHSFEEVLKLGQENEIEHNPPKAEDPALIMYTSGTTGNPKGVVITHKNVISVIAGIKYLVDNLLKPLEDVICSFLPLAHILAFAVDCYLLHLGVRIAYATPRTLTDTSVRKCKGDLREARPTLIVGVPQIYDQIRKGILNKINSSGSVSQTVFGKSMWIKRQFSRAGVPTFLLDALVFNKIKEQVGGRLRWAVSGGAPLSEETRDFFSTAVCHLLQGYGLTETTGLAFVNTPDINHKENIGQITPANEFKIVDVPEAGYLHTNDPPQGEIWFRGGSISEGYYKNEEASKEAFTEDGWFMSGDIVTMHPDGTLSIIDRKKNLVKLANGEYIALERLESYYRNCLYVQNVCVCANSYKPKPVALVQVNLEALNHFAKSNGMEPFHDLEAASKSDAARKEVLKGLHAEAKKAKFHGAELVADIYLSHKEWTSDNGLLTTSQKLKRKPINDEFKANLDAMYNKI